MTRLVFAAVLLVVAFVALAHAEASEAVRMTGGSDCCRDVLSFFIIIFQQEKQEFRRCTALSDDGCATCSKEAGCGWCGVYTDQGEEGGEGRGEEGRGAGRQRSFARHFHPVLPFWAFTLNGRVG